MPSKRKATSSSPELAAPIKLLTWQIPPTRVFEQNPDLKGRLPGLNGNGPRNYYLGIHRRAGKDIMCWLWAIYSCLLIPGYQVLYIHKSLKAAKLNVIDAHFQQAYPGAPTGFMEMIPEDAEAKINRTLCFVEFPNGSMIRFAGADSLNVRGQEVNMVIQSECAFYKNWNEVQAQASAALGRTGGGVSVFASTLFTRDHYYNMVKGVGIKRDAHGRWADRKNNYRLFLTNSQTEKHDGSPIVPDEWIEEEVRAGRMPREVADREYKGLVDGTLFGAVFGKEVRDARNNEQFPLNIPYNKNMPVITSWDLGSGHPTVICFWQEHGGCYNLIDHMVYERVTPGYIAGKVLDWADKKDARFEQHYLPWDAAKMDKYGARSDGGVVSTYDLLSQAGMKNIVVTGRPRVKREGLDLIRSLFPFFRISQETSDKVIDALTEYRYATTPDERAKEQPERNQWSSDYVDAIQSLALGVSGRTLARSVERDTRLVYEDEVAALNEPGMKFLEGSYGWMSR